MQNNNYLNDSSKSFGHAIEASARFQTDFSEAFQLKRDFEKRVYKLAGLLELMVTDHSVSKSVGTTPTAYLEQAERLLQQFWDLVPKSRKSEQVELVWNELQALLLKGRQFISS